MRRIDRRSFAGQLIGAATLGALRGSSAPPGQPPLCFSTLGCPAWDWRTILEQARRMGFQGIELRGIQGRMELPESPEFARDGWKTSLKDVKAMDP